MKRTKLLGSAASLLLVLSLSTAPAKAQFAGFGGGNDQDMMTQFAPMLEMMKAKMGKKRFGMLMQTMGPMMARMMDGNGGFGGMNFGAVGNGGMTPGFGGYGVDPSMSPGFAGFGGGDIMTMIPQLMNLANIGGGHHRRHRAKR